MRLNKTGGVKNRRPVKGDARTEKARAILSAHFNMPAGEAESYISLAARREGIKVSEIENEVIKLGCGLV